MSTISNERIQQIMTRCVPFHGECAAPVSVIEVKAMATELLALRKEREKVEPVAYMIGGHYLIHANDPEVDNYSSAVPLYTAPPAPVVPEGWKLVPIELTKEMRGKIHPFAEATCLNCGRQVVADCEDNVTASWNDMLAVAPAPVGKQSSTAEGNNDGFECTPVADLYELLTKCGECYDYTTSAKVVADWIKEGYSAQEYVKLERLQEAMTQGSSGEEDDWIPCSERMPEEGGRYWCYVEEINSLGKSHYQWNCSWNGEDWGGEGFYGRVTHWQPLPEPPCK